MRKISSMEVAQIMLDYAKPISINGLLTIIARKHPDVELDRWQIGSMVRSFVKSKSCTCVAIKTCYPHKYQLLTITGYTFKTREASKKIVKELPLYAKCGTLAIIKENEKKQQEQSSSLARDFFRLLSGFSGRRASENGPAHPAH